MSLLDPIPLQVSAFVVRHKKYFIIAAIILIAVLAIWMRSRLNRPEPLNEAEVLKAQQAIKENNDAALREILVAVETREKQIEANG